LPAAPLSSMAMTEVSDALEFQKKELFFWFDGQIKMKDKTIVKLKQQIQEMREQHERELRRLHKELKASQNLLNDAKEEHEETTANLLTQQKTYEDGIRAITNEFRTWAQMRNAAQEDWAGMVMNYDAHDPQPERKTPSLSAARSHATRTPFVPSTGRNPMRNAASNPGTPPEHDPFAAPHSSQLPMPGQRPAPHHSGSRLRLTHPPAGSGRRGASKNIAAINSGQKPPPGDFGTDTKVGGHGRRRYSARRARRPPRQPRRPLTEPRDGNEEEEAGDFLADDIGRSDYLPASPSGYVS